MKKNLILHLFLVASFLLTSCASREKLVYYNNYEEFISKPIPKIETEIQVDDLLMIIVSAQEPEAAMPFNLMSNLTVMRNNEAGTAQQQQQMYLVDGNGNIEFPVLGKINVINQPKELVVKHLQEQISKYIKNPIVNLRIMNFKVTVQGEVVRPGVHTITTERLTISEALSLSGDLTIYGERNNIILIREENGNRQFHRLDLTNSDIINSPYYFLKQNDIVYVEPNKTRVNASAVGPNTSIFISIASLLITIITLIAK